MATYDVALTASPSSYTLRLIVTQVSQDIGANTSVVSWSLRIIKNTGTGRWSFYTKSWSVNIGGQTASGTIPSYDFRDYTELVLGSESFTITHDADGSKTISNSGTFNDSGVVNIGSGTASGSLALTTIPRASTPSFSASTVDAGDPITINTNRASGAFTHTVKYVFGGASGTIASGVGASTVWTPPETLLSQIPNSTTGTVTITLETYSGATLIGTKSATFTLRAADTVVPTISSVTATENVSLVSTEVGAFVKSLSRLNVAIVGAAGVYGSTIASNTITVAGQTIAAASGVTAVLGSSGVLPVVGTVVDSRGRTASTTINITVLDYVAPSIDTALTFIRRSDNAGVLDEQGTYLRIDLKAAVQSLLVSAVEKNTITYRVSSRLRGDTVWTVKTTVTPAGVAFNSFFTISTYAVENSWEVLVEVLDKFGQANLQDTVATAAVFMHWAEDGLGLGKFYETGRGTVDSIGQMYQNDGLAVLDESYSPPAATTTVAGISEFATTAETIAGTDPTRAVTPLGLASVELDLSFGSSNLIINGDFRVNQRAAVSGTSLANDAYFLDRWKSGTATNAVTWTGSSAAGRVLTIPASESIYQVIERANVPAGTYTLAWEGTAQARVYNAGGSVPALASSPITVTLDGTDDVRVTFAPGTVSKVCFTPGSAERPFTPRPIQQELALCQRYYYRISSGDTGDAYGIGVVSTSTNISFAVPFPVTMRAKPTLEASAAAGFEARTSGVFTASAVALSGAVTETMGMVDITISGGTAGQAAIVRSNATGGTTGYLGFIAEL